MFMHLTHVEIPRLRDATELNNDGMLKFDDVLYKTDPNLTIFQKEISTMTPVSVRLFFRQLTCSVMSVSYTHLTLPTKRIV